MAKFLPVPESEYHKSRFKIDKFQSDNKWEIVANKEQRIFPSRALSKVWKMLNRNIAKLCFFLTICLIKTQVET